MALVHLNGHLNIGPIARSNLPFTWPICLHGRSMASGCPYVRRGHFHGPPGDGQGHLYGNMERPDLRPPLSLVTPVSNSAFDYLPSTLPNCVNLSGVPVASRAQHTS
jgi:hypothetical protein